MSPRSGGAALRPLPLRLERRVAALKEADRALAAALPGGLRVGLPAKRPTLHLICASIIGQSISVRAAACITDRLSSAAGGVDALTPKSVLKLGEDGLRALGVTGGKARAIRGVAELWRDRRWDESSFASLEDFEIAGALESVKGIGPWTSQMFLIFGLRRPDVLPVKDLGLAEALRIIHGLAERPRPGEIPELAESWRPFRTVGTVAAWAFLMRRSGSSLESGSAWWTSD